MVDAPDDSILSNTKKVLGMDPSYTPFDQDIIMHINSTFLILSQLGLGPDDGFEIIDDTTGWSEYIGTDKNLNAVKSYMYAKVRQIFDPPATSFALDALQKVISEYEWRLMVQVDPKPPLPLEPLFPVPVVPPTP